MHSISSDTKVYRKCRLRLRRRRQVRKASKLEKQIYEESVEGRESSGRSQRRVVEYMKIGSPFPHKKARIEIIPLIDIMFFLLASFLMASLSMMRLQAIKDVDLPKAL